MRTAEEFWAMVDRASDCWLWTGGRSGRNHERGIVNWYGQITRPYRVALLLTGLDPGQQHVHHLCEDPLCVRPDHLLLVSPAEHNGLHLDSHCKWGHPLSGDNLRVVQTGPNAGRRRYCAACSRRNARTSYRARKGRSA